MKKVFTLLLGSAISIASYAQVKKVVLEDFTGTWCGWCPEGTIVLEGLKVTHGANFFPVASHNGDGLQVPDGAAIDNGLNVTAYPNGAVDRVYFNGNAKISMSRGAWASKTTERLNSTAVASVSFTNPYIKTVGSVDSYYVDVNVNFTSAPKANTPIAINVYVLEDSIAAVGSLDQDNYSSTVQGGASPLTNWFHNHTLRDALLGAWGDATVIGQNPTVGTTFTKKVGFVIPATWKKDQIHLLAFTALDGAKSGTSTDLEILNSEDIKLSSFYPTSILNQELVAGNNVTVYPNPVSNKAMLSFSYELNQDENLDINILNSLGQVVASPYKNIFDIKGFHTLQVQTADYELNKGLYFIEIKSKNGSSLTKFSIN